MSAPLTPEDLRADVAGLLFCDPAELDLDEDLVERGLDSIRLMTLVDRWRRAGAADLEFPDLAENPNLAHWATVVVP